MLNKRSILICVLLGAITLTLYGPARSFNFVDFDDNEYVMLNPKVQAGVTWDGIDWAFQTYYASNWHPLTWISLMLDAQLYGMNAGGYHFTNALLHSFNAMLLFLVLLRMTGAAWPSSVVAALFAWHPMHVESVAWVAERKDVLSTFFGLLTMLAYSFYGREKRNKGTATIYYVAALFCFALSLLAKPMLVTLPFLLLLLDYWPLGRMQFADTKEGAESKTSAGERRLEFRGCLIEKIPFFLFVVVSSMFTIAAQSASGAMKMNEQVPLMVRVEHALVVYVKYVKMMFWPARLAVFYPHTGAPTMGHTVAALVVLIAISFVALQWLRDAPYFPVGWFWYLGTLVPVIGILQVGNQAMADRYTYFPYIGLFIALVWGGSLLWERWKRRRFVLNAVVIAVLAACLALSSIQLQYWKNSFTLADHARKVTDSNFVAYGVMSDYAGHAGNYDEAIRYAKTSIGYMPNYPPAYYFLGLAYLESGKIDDAVASLSEAARLRPQAQLTHQKLGRALYLQGRLDEAFEQFSIAAKMDPSDSISESQLGLICSRKKDFAGAIQHYQAALALKPDSVQVLNNLAWILAANENPEFRNGPEAVRLARRACDATQNKEPILLGTLAAAYAEAGDFDNAVSTAIQARDLALAANKKSIADRNQKLLELYRSGHAFHEGAGLDGARN